MLRYTLTTLAIAVILASCNITRVVKPLEKNEIQVGASLGGPMITFAEAPIPIPLTSLHAAYGYSERVSAMVGIHTTALAFGVMQLDFGANYQLYKNQTNDFGVSGSTILNGMFDIWENNLAVYPQLDLNVWRNVGKNLFYGNVSTWIEASRKRAHGEPQPNQFMPSIGLGYQRFKNKYGFQAEVKYIAPHLSNRDIVVDYISPGQRGAIGIYMGVIRRF
jgi:hypothetical protein